MERAIINMTLTASLLLLCAAGAPAAEEKTASAGVQEAFQKFARAVKDDKFQEVVKYIAPPADKVWIYLAAVQAAAAKYEAALNQKFGKSDTRSFLEERFGKPNLARRYYEARGTIRAVKEIGKDRAVVTVWTRGPRFGDDRDRIYERRFTAVKVDGQWKFQLRLPLEGSPVVKAVKRTGLDGKTVEVYAEHDPAGSPDQKKWKEMEPTSYEGAEDELKLGAKLFARIAEVIPAQMEQVQKGSYKSRKEALDTLEKAIREQYAKAREEWKKGRSRP